MKKKFSLGLIAILMISSIVSAEGNKKFLSVSGWGWLTMGQVVNTEPNKLAVYPEFDNEWLSDIQAGIKLTSAVSSRTTCQLHLMTSFQLPVITVTAGADNSEPLQKSFSISILEASMRTHWNVGSSDSIVAEYGYFPVKYNSDAMNLGEYLFRSNTYPGLLVSGFEVADKVKMAGLHTGYKNHSSIGNSKLDIYLNTETEAYPTYNLSLSYIASYSTSNEFFEISTGVSHQHLVAFDEKRITPGKSSSYGTMATSFVDPLTGDTTNYTFRGTKVAGKVSFDIKKLFDTKIFGEKDLRVYAEAALLGVKDYPGWYHKIRERVPIMFGLNIPTFKILDVLAVEAEYYPSPYANAYHFVWKGNTPVPYFENVSTYSGVDYYSDLWNKKDNDDWKWSVYASKKIGCMRISGQVASDHTSKALYLPAGKKLYNEMVPRSQDWYYMLRCGFFF